MNCEKCKRPLLRGDVWQVLNANSAEHVNCPRVLTKKEIMYWHRKDIAKYKREIAVLQNAIREDAKGTSQIIHGRNQ